MVRQTDAQALGIKGEQWFPVQLPKYWIAQKPTYDLGVDFVVVITEQNQYNGLEFRVQIKSSRKWTRRGSTIIVTGVKRTTARDWVSGSSPTLLVFYDEHANQGWYAWALEALPEIPKLLSGKSKTINIKAKSPLMIDSECWNKIRSDLVAGVRLLSEAIKTGRVANIVFPKIRDIARCLQLLHLAEFNPDAKESNERFLLEVSQAVAHRDIVLSTLRILEKLDPACLFARHLRSTIESYKSRVSEFYNEFDRMLHNTDENTAIWQNPEKSKDLRPEMIQRATEILIALAGLGNADSST